MMIQLFTICDLSRENVPNSQPFLNGQPFISHSSRQRYRLNGSSYPFKKISIRLNGSSYLFKKIRLPFERFELSVQVRAVKTARAMRSKTIVSHLNGANYPLKNRQPLERFELSRSKKICQPFQLSVRKNKSATNSFHCNWKVKGCKKGKMFLCHFGSIIEG